MEYEQATIFDNPASPAKKNCYITARNVNGQIFTERCIYNGDCYRCKREKEYNETRSQLEAEGVPYFDAIIEAKKRLRKEII